MDVLAEVMSLLRTKGQLYGRLELSAPFALEFPGGKGICLIVTRGSCFLGVDKHAVVPLVGGDFVFLPGPKSYSLRSRPEMRVRSVLEITTEEQFHRSRLITHGGGGTPASVVAGCFTFASPESEMLIKHLPAIIFDFAIDRGRVGGGFAGIGGDCGSTGGGFVCAGDAEPVSVVDVEWEAELAGGAG